VLATGNSARIQEAEHGAVQTILLGRIVAAEDIASLIVFLVSAQASAITGQVIAVDGSAGWGLFS
jgi:NAD(P)-dependent dehydrogenase (short-subunit alcohol dehydrogenase family)